MKYTKRSPLVVWHFADATLRYGSPLPKKGDVLPTINKPVPCVRGWHGSVSLLDALRYAPGANLSRRGLYGTVREHGDPIDKYCSSRAVMQDDYRDVSAALIRFARRAALHALRVDVAGAMRRAGVDAHADALATLADDCDLRAAANAARAAANAADAAAYAAANAANAARAAANAADAAANAAAYAAANAARAAADAAAYAANAAADAAAYAAAYAARAAALAARAAARIRLESWLLEEVAK